MSKSDMVHYIFKDGKFRSVQNFKDGTPFSFNLTREEIEQFLRDNNKARAIDSDDDKLIANYVALAERLHNREVKARKEAEREASGIPRTLGGKREGAGRKPKGGDEKLRYSWRCSRDVWEILQQQDNKTEFIENAIRAYARYLGIKIKRGGGD